MKKINFYQKNDLFDIFFLKKKTMKRKINKDDTFKYLFSNVNYIFPKFLDRYQKINISKNVLSYHYKKIF